ncbi:diguanylate cyclase [Secundilactobacillus muriivasis]
MIVQFLDRDLPLFLVRIATVTFFSIGFIQFFQRTWNEVFDGTSKSKGNYWLRRSSLTLLTVGLGLFIHYDAMLFIHNDSAILYHNWSLFVLVLPLLFDGFKKFEIFLQFASLIIVWYMHHAPTFFHPDKVATLLAFIGACILLKNFHEYVMKNWWVGAVGAFVLSSVFWFTVPEHSMGMSVPVDLALEAVLLFTIMTTLVLGYWMRQYRDDQRQHNLERLAEYEKGVSDNSYANHQQELQKLFVSMRDAGSPLSFATLDLDHFRQINDRFGHLAGNAVLISVTDTIKEILDSTNVEHQLFSTTGEEFNIVFPKKSVDSILPIVKACWQGIRKRDFSYDDRSIDVTISVGMTSLRSEDISVNDIYKRADDALSKGKRNGRDAFVLDNKLLSGADRSEKRLEDYQLFAQGIFAVSEPDMPLTYQELLLRTYDPIQKRWILPDSFEIPVWMQITLIKNFMSHTDVQYFNLNLTAAQFQDLDIAKALTQFVESSEGPESMTIEIMDLTDSQTTRRISALYRASGMDIMIDDVGSDNSFEAVRGSLPYINGVKFAMQNLRKSITDEALHERIEFWLQTAKERDLKFVLEGVENEDDLRMANELGIEYIQGYYFGKPSRANGLSEGGK